MNDKKTTNYVSSSAQKIFANLPASSQDSTHRNIVAALVVWLKTFDLETCSQSHDDNVANDDRGFNPPGIRTERLRKTLSHCKPAYTYSHYSPNEKSKLMLWLTSPLLPAVVVANRFASIESARRSCEKTCVVIKIKGTNERSSRHNSYDQQRSLEIPVWAASVQLCEVVVVVVVVVLVVVASGLEWDGQL